jgi:hypothetical protein
MKAALVCAVQHFVPVVVSLRFNISALQPPITDNATVRRQQILIAFSAQETCNAG